VATFPTVRGERAALRLMYEVGQINGLGELGLPDGMVEVLAGAAERPQGLILVTGPAGSGKSTTLYALARHILAATPGRSVVGLEDPVEQRISGVAQIQVQPHGELDYVRAMRSLLRQDVQVLLVGEIRDVETAHIVVEAALTGHLIMSTLHSGDPAEAIIRLVEMGIPPYQLVGALTTVCSQRLLRTICPSCHGQGLPVKIGEAQYGKEGGCPNCMGSGYAGRVACGQVMAMSEALRQAILEHRPAGELRRIIAESGPDLVADAQRLLAEGRTTTEEIQRVLGQST
jgi:type II secretory ATPase GspE/PulE/Tfp pilus assembly ATPase PilB-like protein